jgi:hypothetical protein
VSDQRIWPNQNSFDPTQNGRVGANPQRQAKDSQYGKTRTAPKHSEAEANVLKKRLHFFNPSGSDSIFYYAAIE